MLSDLRFVLRQLAKAPGFGAVAVALLALGIGASAAFLSVFKAQALAPFPYPKAARVVQLWRGSRSFLESNPWSAPDFLDLHDECTALAESGAYRPDLFNLGGEHPEVLRGVACTPGVLRSLGVQPALGRWFTDEEGRDGAARVAILSHACWAGHFNRDPGLIGHIIRLNAQDYIVAGVMPENFEFYCPWTGSQPTDLWVPLALARNGQGRDSYWLLAVGRLRDGATVEGANAEMNLLANRLAAAYPDTNFGQRFYARTLPAELVGRAVVGRGLVAAAVALVLLVACANLATMFLARGAGRQTEFAVRLALGAGRWALIRLALVESLIIALAGGAAGVWIAWCGVGLLSRLFPPENTHAVPIRFDPAVLGCSLALAIVSALAAGIPPALTAARTQVVAMIKEGGVTQAGSRMRHRFLRHLVSAQVGIALLLVNTALLLLASYHAAVTVNRPIASEYVLSAQIAVQGGRYDSDVNRTALWERLLERVRSLPAVAAAGMTTQIPLRGGNNTEIIADGEEFDPKVGRPSVELSYVSPGYFSAIGLTRLRGRTFEPSDARPETSGVLVNQALADRYWPGQDPVGKRVRGNTRAPWFTARVVGVVLNVRQWGIERPPQPEIYFPYDGAPGSTYLVLRSTVDAHRMVPVLRRELAAIDRDLALSEPLTMAEVVRDEARGLRTLLLLTQFFMAAALLIAAIGIYGTLSFQTRQRTREIGVRLALGADPRDVVLLVIRQAVPWVVGGGAVGLALSVGLAYALSRMMTDVSPFNPLFYGAGCMVLSAAVALACCLPAWRATRVSPGQALRTE